MRFILDLIGINVGSLLAVFENNEEDLKIVREFEVYLHTYIHKHKIGPKFPEQFLVIKVSPCFTCIYFTIKIDWLI